MLRQLRAAGVIAGLTGVVAAAIGAGGNVLIWFFEQPEHRRPFSVHEVFSSAPVTFGLGVGIGLAVAALLASSRSRRLTSRRLAGVGAVSGALVALTAGLASAGFADWLQAPLASHVQGVLTLGAVGAAVGWSIARLAARSGHRLAAAGQEPSQIVDGEIPAFPPPGPRDQMETALRGAQVYTNGTHT